mmetsp:Transcript_3659/g.6972  ORF Transcript_3659/g.6972 Transcript_3659/m.6972 type:complete len:84 (+) Transcript_3659:1700-1951(+)
MSLYGQRLALDDSEPPSRIERNGKCVKWILRSFGGTSIRNYHFCPLIESQKKYLCPIRLDSSILFALGGERCLHKLPLPNSLK